MKRNQMFLIFVVLFLLFGLLFTSCKNKEKEILIGGVGPVMPLSGNPPMKVVSLQLKSGIKMVEFWGKR